MKFWKCPSWRIQCKKDGVYVENELSRPYALVGSADFCDVKLDGNAPPVKYYLHRTTNCIEMHSLVPQDFVCASLLNGSAADGGEFHVHYDRALADAEVNLWPIVKFTINGRQRSVLLNQRVTVVGREFPSRVRIPDSRLDKCQLVLIWEAGRMWVLALPGPNSSYGLQTQCLDVGGFVVYKGVCIALSGVVNTHTFTTDCGHRRSPIAAGLELEEKIRRIFKSRYERKTKVNATVTAVFGLVVTISAVWLGWELWSKLSPYVQPSMDVESRLL